jgi:DNA-binding transcriptional LysR family regulator
MLAYAERLLRLSSQAEAAIRTGTPRGTLRLGTLGSTAGPRRAAGSGALSRELPGRDDRDRDRHFGRIAENEVATYPLPERVSKSTTHLVWRNGHHSVALDAMRKALGRLKR